MNEPTTQAGRELAALHTLVPVIGLPGGHVTGYCRTDGADWPCRVVRSIPKIEAEARADRDAEVAALREAVGGFIWLGNNLHNSGTATFRDLYEAALVDARLALLAQPEPTP